MNTEAEVVVAQTPGVRSTQGVRLFLHRETGFVTAATDPATAAQIVSFDPWQLPELLQVDVAVDAAGPPTSMEDRTGLGVGDGGGAGIAIPIVPELC